MELNERSKQKLKGVHPDLIRVILRAALSIPDGSFGFIVTEGSRSLERQKLLFAEGKSKTMNSRHLKGDAVDVAVTVDGAVTWDFKHYEELSKIILGAAKELNIPVVWGGSWTSFKDGPHFELDRRFYP